MQTDFYSKTIDKCSPSKTKHPGEATSVVIKYLILWKWVFLSISFIYFLAKFPTSSFIPIYQILMKTLYVSTQKLKRIIIWKKWKKIRPQFSSVQFSRSVMSDSLWSHESQHARPPCPSPTPGVHSDSCPSSQWCHPAISSSVVLFSSCRQSLPASRSFPMSQLFTWGGQSTGVGCHCLLRIITEKKINLLQLIDSKYSKR